MKKTFGLVGLGILAFGLSACDESNSVDPNNNGSGSVKEQYVVCYSSGSSGYLMQVDDITSGKLDGTQNTNNRQQVTGNRDYVQVGYDYLYNINYASQGANGVSTISTSWELGADNQLQQRADLDLSGDVKSRGLWGKYIIGASSLTKDETSYERIKIIDTENDRVVNNNGSINTTAGEFDPAIPEHVSFSDIAPYGDYLLMALRTKNSTEKSAVSELMSNTYVAVYKYDGNAEANLELQKVIIRESTANEPAGQIRGNRKSRTETGIEPVDNGDIYLFCQSVDTPAEGFSQPPAAVLRISGANIQNGMPVAIDKDYYCNIQELAEGHRVWKSFYMGGTTFCLQMYTEKGDEKTSSSTKLKFAIFDAATKNFKWVTGVPATISDVALPVLIEREKDRVVFAITTTDQNPALYTVSKDGQMIRGLEIVAEAIEGVAKLAYKE